MFFWRYNTGGMQARYTLCVRYTLCAHCSSSSGTVINYGSGSGSDFLTSYGSGYGSGSTSQKVTVPTVPVPVPVPQHWFLLLKFSRNRKAFFWIWRSALKCWFVINLMLFVRGTESRGDKPWTRIRPVVREVEHGLAELWLASNLLPWEVGLFSFTANPPPPQIVEQNAA